MSSVKRRRSVRAPIAPWRPCPAAMGIDVVGPLGDPQVSLECLVDPETQGSFFFAELSSVPRRPRSGVREALGTGVGKGEAHHVRLGGSLLVDGHHPLLARIEPEEH